MKFWSSSARASCLVALLSCAAAAQPLLVVEDDALEATYETYVRSGFVRRALHRAGLDHAAVRAANLPGRRFDQQHLAILPSNPTLTDAQAAWLQQFTAAGGRLMVFAPVPPQLAGLLGVAELAPLRTAGSSLHVSVGFDTDRLPSLPDAWTQADWVVQPLLPEPTTGIIGWYIGEDPTLEGLPAVTTNRVGIVVGTAPLGDDRVAEAQLILALLAAYRPVLYHDALPRMIAGIGRVGDARDLDQLRDLVLGSSSAGRERALTALKKAYDRRLEARRQLDLSRAQGSDPSLTRVSPGARYMPAARLAWEGQEAAEQAYYLAQTGRAREFRGVWLQQMGNLAVWGWDRAVTALADNSFDALFVNVVNAGYANYPSQVLPHVTAEGEDPLADALRASRQAKIECHVWLMVNYLRPLTPPEHRQTLAAADRLQRDAEGRLLPWLRPAHPANLAQLAAVAREIVTRYDVDGLHLDYIRYPPEGDYSDAERADFEAWLNTPVDQWPGDIAPGRPLRTRWTTWRQEQINRQARTVAETVRAVRPQVRVSAAVYPIWVDARLKVGQDPETWARAGWVDFLSPMNYQTNDTTFYRYLKVQQAAVGNSIPLYPGVAAWRQETPADTISQIRRLRTLDMPGFILFHLDRRLAREWLPAFRLGLTAPDPWLGPAPPRS